MPGERLFEFDCDLCDYVLGNIRQHLHGLAERPSPAPFLHPGEWDMLDFPDWFARQFTTYMPELGDHIWAGVFGEPVQRPLSDAELDALVMVMKDPPVRLEPACEWMPYPGLHARSVECVPEVREALTRRTTEEWAEASAMFAARLCEEGLSLAAGIGVVQEWLWHLRRLLRVMGGGDSLPVPPGTDSTPTHPNPNPAPHPRRKSRSGRERGTDASGAETPVMLSPARITAKYAVSRSTVYAACRAGLLTHYRVPARKGARGKYLVKEDDLRAWLESVRVGPGSPPPSPSASAPASSGSAASPFSELNPERLARVWREG